MQKVCLLIGVGSFGHYIIQKYLDEGYKVIATTRSSTSLLNFEEKFKNDVDFLLCDLTNSESIKLLFERCKAKYQGWDRIIFHARNTVSNKELNFDNANSAFAVSCSSLIHIFNNIDSWWKYSGDSVFIVTNGNYMYETDPERAILSTIKSTQHSIVKCYKGKLNFKLHEAVILGQALVDTPLEYLLKLYI